MPIPHGGSREEQLRNAQTLEAAGAGWCVPEAAFDAASLANLLTRLLSSQVELPPAAAAAVALAKPQAAGALADLVETQLARAATVAG